MSGIDPSTIRHRGMITIALMLATIMQALDTTIANVALPNMQGSLNAAQDTVTWVLTSYIVSSAIVMPATGWLADQLGRKRLFMASVAGFTITSALCGAATSLEEMVFFRILQGVFGAALVPLSQAVLLDINPRERHGQAMAIWGAGIMVGPIAGPSLGGWLTDAFNWRWVFYINLPVGILAFLGMLAFLPETPLRKRSFDFFGFALLSLGVGALQLMLDRGEQLDWFSSTEIVVEFALVLTGMWMFGVHLLTSRGSFIDTAILKDRNFVTSLVFIFMIGIILFASMTLLPPMLQNLMGYPTVTTGLVLAPRGVGTMISMLAVGRLVRKVDARLLITVGLSLTALSLWQMTQFTIMMGEKQVIISGIVQGLGLGLVFVPLTTLAFATLDPRFRNDGTSLFSLVRSVGSSIGISIVISLLSQNTQVNHAVLAGHVTPFNPALDVNSLVGAGGLQALARLDAMVNQQASMIAFLDDFKLMMFVTLAAIPMLLLMRKPKQARAAPPAEMAAE